MKQRFLLGVWTAFAFLSLPGHAETFEVTVAFDAVDARPGDGRCQSPGFRACTLRAAVMEANALPGFHTIVLRDDTTYILSIPSNEPVWDNRFVPPTQFDPMFHDDSSGDLDLLQPITIRGAGPNTIVRVADDLDYRIFDIASGLKPRAELRDLTLRGGTNLDNRGGGCVRVARSRILLHEVVVDDCETIDDPTQTSFGGGGVFLEDSSGRIERSIFTANRTHDGGGAVLCSTGALTVDASSLFLANEAIWLGGAIVSANCTTEILAGLSAGPMGGFYGNRACLGAAVHLTASSTNPLGKRMEAAFGSTASQVIFEANVTQGTAPHCGGTLSMYSGLGWWDDPHHLRMKVRVGNSYFEGNDSGSVVKNMGADLTLRPQLGTCMRLDEDVCLGFVDNPGVQIDNDKALSVGFSFDIFPKLKVEGAYFRTTGGVLRTRDALEMTLRGSLVDWMHSSADGTPDPLLLIERGDINIVHNVTVRAHHSPSFEWARVDDLDHLGSQRVATLRDSANLFVSPSGQQPPVTLSGPRASRVGTCNGIGMDSWFKPGVSPSKLLAQATPQVIDVCPTSTSLSWIDYLGNAAPNPLGLSDRGGEEIGARPALLHWSQTESGTLEDWSSSVP